MSDSVPHETHWCNVITKKDVFMQGVHYDMPIACGEIYDIPSKPMKICMVCGSEEGKGHTDSDWGGNGPRKQVIYADVTASGPWCKNGHRQPLV